MAGADRAPRDARAWLLCPLARLDPLLSFTFSFSLFVEIFIPDVFNPPRSLLSSLLTSRQMNSMCELFIHLFICTSCLRGRLARNLPWTGKTTVTFRISSDFSVTSIFHSFSLFKPFGFRSTSVYSPGEDGLFYPERSSGTSFFRRFLHLSSCRLCVDGFKMR